MFIELCGSLINLDTVHSISPSDGDRKTSIQITDINGVKRTIGVAEFENMEDAALYIEAQYEKALDLHLKSRL